MENIISDDLNLRESSVVLSDYCEEGTPDPIPNSEVKLFCADGTTSLAGGRVGRC